MDSIVSAINKDSDDNDDLNSLNDIDDEFTATYMVDKYGTGTFQIKQNNPSKNFTIAIEDNDTNFAGALGLHRFFDGIDAKDIRLNRNLKEDPTLVNAYKPPVNGDMTIANDMQQLQYERIDFYSHDRRSTNNETIGAFYKLTTVEIATDTDAILLEVETKTAVFKAVEMEQDSISKVSIDEELTNLMRFQTGYTANAKVITTIDQMLDTVLGLKR
jgi:flagellar hook-associated protein 1 FlgK